MSPFAPEIFLTRDRFDRPVPRQIAISSMNTSYAISKASIGTSTYAMVVQEIRDTEGMIQILQLEHSIAKSLVRCICMLWLHILQEHGSTG